jgi:hypothetical protein
MARYIPELDLWFPFAGEEAAYEDGEGPQEIPDQPDDLNHAVALNNLVERVAAGYTRVGTRAEQPAAEADSPPLFLVTDATDADGTPRPALEANVPGLGGWQLVSAGGGGGGGSGGVSESEFSTHVSQFQNVSKRVADAENAIANLQGAVGSVEDSLFELSGDVDSLETDLIDGQTLYQRTDEPPSPVDGDWWLDISQTPRVLSVFDSEAGSFIRVGTGGDGSGGDGTNAAPTARFTVTPTTPETGQSVTFNAGTSTDPDGDATIASYEWDFQSSGTTDAFGETVDHSFATAGDYRVELTVTDDAGASDMAATTVTVSKAGVRQLDSWEHQDHTAHYSKQTNVSDWTYVADAVDGSVAIECTTGNSRYMVTYPGDSSTVGDFGPGQTARLATKLNGTGGRTGLLFGCKPNAAENRYELYLNDDLDRVVLERRDSTGPDPLSVVTGTSFDPNQWYVLEVGHFPQGGYGLPWRWLDLDGTVLASDLDATDDSTGLYDDPDSGWGIRSNSTRGRFDDARVADDGF